MKTGEGGARIRILAGNRFFQELEEAGLADLVREGCRNSIETLERLRLYVGFPNGLQFESQVREPIEQSVLSLTINGYPIYGLFNYFYPSGRPLPVANQTLWDLDKRLKNISIRMCLQEGPGLELRVPPDLEKLGQIKGKFVLI